MFVCFFHVKCSESTTYCLVSMNGKFRKSKVDLGPCANNNAMTTSHHLVSIFPSSFQICPKDGANIFLSCYLECTMFPYLSLRSVDQSQRHISTYQRPPGEWETINWLVFKTIPGYWRLNHCSINYLISFYSGTVAVLHVKIYGHFFTPF